SPLAFSLGMYLPMSVNSPLLIGGFIAWKLARSSTDERVAKARTDKGTLVASGLIAGAAILDFSVNALAIFDEQLNKNRIMPALDFSSRMIEKFGGPDRWARLNNWF